MAWLLSWTGMEVWVVGTGVVSMDCCWFSVVCVVFFGVAMFGCCPGISCEEMSEMRPLENSFECSMMNCAIGFLVMW